MALVWKEISTDSDIQVKRNIADSSATAERIRIRRIWQLANCQATYADEIELEQEQNKNDFANMEYISPVTFNGNEWFSGDIVPFERCAYVVNINVDVANDLLTLNFHRLTTSLKYDPIFGYKKVVT